MDVGLVSEQCEDSHGSGAELFHTIVPWFASLVNRLKDEQQARNEEIWRADDASIPLENLEIVVPVIELLPSSMLI